MGVELDFIEQLDCDENLKAFLSEVAADGATINEIAAEYFIMTDDEED